MYVIAEQCLNCLKLYDRLLIFVLYFTRIEMFSKKTKMKRYQNLERFEKHCYIPNYVDGYQKENAISEFEKS